MSGYDWFLCGWWVFSIVVTVATTGKPRTPTTPGVSAITVCILLSLMVGLLVSRGAFA